MAAQQNFTIEQGASFRVQMTWTSEDGTPVDMTGCEARLQIRRSYRDRVVLVDLATPTQGIELDLPVSAIRIHVSDEVSAGLASGTYVYDLLVSMPGGDKVRLLEGQIDVSPGVTKWPIP